MPPSTKTNLPQLSPYQQHFNKWKDCTDCKLFETRKRVVLYKGKVPCDILFIGEAPGVSEDCIGLPFEGPAGQLLDSIISRAIPEKYRLCFGNMLGCIPVDSQGKKAVEPDDADLEACSPRVSEIISITSPKFIVAVGKIPGDWLTPGYRHSVKRCASIPFQVIVHPAAILRSNITAKGLLIQRNVSLLEDVVDRLNGEEFFDDRKRIS